MNGLDLRPGVLLDLGAIVKLHIDGLLLSVAGDEQSDVASGRGFAKHAAELLNALHLLPVHLEDNVVNAQADLSGRSVMVDNDDLRTRWVLQLEGGGPL